MKKLKKAQSGTVIGSEQGKKAKNLRRAGIAIPTIGAAALALKSGINKIKNKKTQKRIQEEYLNETQRKNAAGAEDFKKTGGMVNSNKKVTTSKKATGRVGGISTAPKKAMRKK